MASKKQKIVQGYADSTENYIFKDFFDSTSTDYINDWESTPEWNIHSTRKFREAVDSTIDKQQRQVIGEGDIYKHMFSNNYEALEDYALFTSLQNLKRPNGYSADDVKTVWGYYTRKVGRNQIKDINPEVHQVIAGGMEKWLRGVSVESAFGIKKQGSGTKDKDETNPPEYIFDITNLILSPDGMSLNKATEEVAETRNEDGVKREDIRTATHMTKMFHVFKMFGYVNWRFENKVLHHPLSRGWGGNLKK
tara:strand:- start:134 stop:883 length:750 start_codon:yes stop_codon:yes gene_type:complete